MKQITRLILSVLIFILLFNVNVFGESTNYNINTPYYSYTYNSKDQPVQTPAPYSVTSIIKGDNLKIDNFENLTDVYYDKETKRIFLTDSDANAIIVLNRDYQLVKVISTFDNNGIQDDFLSPSATCVRNGKLYVADTGKERIVRFNANTFQLESIMGRPKVNILDDNYKYKPRHIAVDFAGRIYVIATDINDGIMLLDENGEFIRFVAAPDVKTTLWTKFLKLFMTKAQKQNLEKAVPTEYSSIQMDEKGFLYLTSLDTTVHPITKLNSQGKDILNYEGDNYPDGDASYILKNTSKIKSTFVDISVREDGIYAAVDTKMGRIFIYNREGTLLYCFGGIGVQNGTFYAPSSIEIFDDTILVTDSFYGTLTVFRQTEFGKTVEQATWNMLQGHYKQAEQHWNNVLRLCPVYDAAIINLARIAIQNDEYSKALVKLEGTTDIKYYSKAFEGVREKFLEENFSVVVLIALIIVVIMIAWHFLKKHFSLEERLNGYKLIREIKYSKHTMYHPFDGFWDLKHEKRGSLVAANVLTVLFILTYALRVKFSGYIFTGVLPSEINTLYEIIKIVLPLGLWVLANWCFTSLMDGEGTMRDIYIATAYALRPYIITAVPLCILSHCLSQDEAFIYVTLSSIVMVYMLALILLGMMITHDYSLSKAIIVTILTLLGICLILFLALTFTNIVQKIYDFAMDLYQEFMYR